MAVSCNDVCPCCESCKGCLGFQKILELQNAGVVIYRHVNRIDEINKTTGLLESSANTIDDIFIIHNKKDARIKADECVSEIDQGIHCPRCKELVQRAMKYLQNVSPIEKKDIVSVCDHCQNKKEKMRSLNDCNKCHGILKKYNFEQFKQTTAKGQIKEWLSNVHKVLDNIITDKRTRKSLKHRSYSDLYLNVISKDTSKPPRYLEVGPILEKGVRISKSFCSVDNDTTKSDYTIKFSDAEYKKSKSVSLRTETFVHMEENIVPSVTTYETIVDINGEVRMPTTSQRSKGILQRDAEFTPESKIKSGRTPQTIRKYYSEEDLFFSAAGLTNRDENKPFSYVFPKELSDEILPLRRVKTSAELLIDTQKMLNQLHDKIKEKVERNLRRPRSVRSEEKKGDSDSAALNTTPESPDKLFSAKGKSVTKKEESETNEIKKVQKDVPHKDKEDKKLRQEQEKDNKIQQIQKEKQERQKVTPNQLLKQKEENQVEKQKESLKEKEVKHKSKTEERTSKPNQTKSESPKLKIQKDEEYPPLKIEAAKKSKEEAPRALKSLKGVNDEKKADKDKEVKPKFKTQEVTSKPNQTKSELPKLKIQKDEEYLPLKIEAAKNSKEEAQHALKSHKGVDGEKKAEKEKEVKQKVNTQHTVKEEKVSTKDEKDKKLGKVQKVEDEGVGILKKMLEERTKEQNDLSKLKKQQDEELYKLKMEAEKKSKEDPQGKLKPHKETYAEKDTKQEKSKGDKKQEEQTHKDMSTKPLKMRAADDLILQLIKLRQLSKRDGTVPPLSEMDITGGMINKLNIQKAKKKLCYALYMDSDLELDLETIKNAQRKPEKTDIIVGDKICKIKQPINEKKQTEEVVPILYKSMYNDEMAPAHLENIPKIKDCKLIPKNVSNCLSFS